MAEELTVPRAAVDLPFTGERFTFAVAGPIEHEHTHRYFLALDLCRARDVLDVASGEGYGSALLGQVARSVIGVDLDPGSVDHANRHYARDGVSFRTGSATELPVETSSVDVVVSFETLEHLDAHEAFLKEIKRALRPGGVLVMSSPDRVVYSPDGPHNPFHLRELDKAQFVDLVSRHFRHHALFGQRSLSGSCLVPDGTRFGPEIRFLERRGDSRLRLSAALPDATYLIAVASDAALPPLPPSLLIDGRYANVVDLERQRLDAELGAALAGRAALDGTVASLASRVEETERALAQRASDEARLRDELARRSIEAEGLRQEVARLEADVARSRDETTRYESLTARLQDEAAGLRADVGRLTAEAERLTAQNAGLTDAVARVQAENAGLRGDVARLDAEKAGLTGEVARLRDTVSKLEEDLARAAGEVARLRDAASKLEEDLARAAGEAARLESEVVDRQRRIGELNGALAELGSEAAWLRHARAEMLASHSWRLTAPLRALGTAARWLRRLL